MAHESDQDLRLPAFEDRGEELEQLFGPLEGDYWRTAGKLRQAIQVYASSHSEDFRR